MGIVAAAAGALAVSEDELAVAASAAAGLAVAASAAAGLTVAGGAAGVSAWVADNLRGWVDGGAE